MGKQIDIIIFFKFAPPKQKFTPHKLFLQFIQTGRNRHKICSTKFDPHPKKPPPPKIKINKKMLKLNQNGEKVNLTKIRIMSPPVKKSFNLIKSGEKLTNNNTKKVNHPTPI